jgi:hypothetical protein
MCHGRSPFEAFGFQAFCNWSHDSVENFDESMIKGG